MYLADAFDSLILYFLIQFNLHVKVSALIFWQTNPIAIIYSYEGFEQWIKVISS